MVDLSLDEWSRRVLWQVCHGGPYLSSVLIAIDLCDLGVISGKESSYLMIELALTELNERGYVVFTQAKATHGRYADDGHTDSSHGRPPITRVRATEDGYIAAGFPPPVRVVGPRHADGNQHPQRPGDQTDWRNHGFHAIGLGPIERMPLRDHIYAYWDHAECHFEALWEIEEMHKGDPH